MKYSTKRFITKSLPLELLSFLVMLSFHCFAEYLTQLAASYKEKCKQIMPMYPGFTLQNAKATSWLNAFKGNEPINEKFPSSFNITEYIQFLGLTASLIDLKNTFVMLLLLILLLDRSKEKAILCTEWYFLYMVFWSYSSVVKNKN